MSVPAIYLQEAQTDVETVYAAYEQQKRGLGERFLGQLRRRVDLISDFVIAVVHGRRDSQIWKYR